MALVTALDVLAAFATDEFPTDELSPRRRRPRGRRRERLPRRQYCGA
ncbi:hypothetical protein [Halapricum desulfuricans]|nr:hypothetical protein [Halapricum desulfuricans]